MYFRYPNNKHEQSTNQNLRGKIARRNASSQQQHTDHENLRTSKCNKEF